jgi:hypothetical protein
MASGVTTDYLSSTLKVTMHDFDPDETTHTDVSWQDMRDFGAVLMTMMHSVGTGTVTAFSIFANAQSDGSGTDATVKDHALGSDPNAVGDYIHLEALASEIVNLATDLRYVSGNISLLTETDECVVTYIFGLPRFAYGSLSADNIS